VVATRCDVDRSGRPGAAARCDGISIVLQGHRRAIGDWPALASSGLPRSLLYDVSGRDPMVFAMSAIGLTGVAMAGYLIPAARASRVDPVTALRSE